MGKFIDLTNQKFGKLTVLQKSKIVNNKQFWLCQCECGNKKEIDVYKLKSQHTRSCGCLRLEINTKPPGYASYHYIFDKYKRGAKYRNLDFRISKDAFIELISKNCYYCGSNPKNYNSYFTNDKRLLDNHVTLETANRGWIAINGLDRLDSNKGYEINNVVPCCSNCNIMKRDIDFNIFMNCVKKIYENHIK